MYDFKCSVVILNAKQRFFQMTNCISKIYVLKLHFFKKIANQNEPLIRSVIYENYYYSLKISKMKYKSKTTECN